VRNQLRELKRVAGRPMMLRIAIVEDGDQAVLPW
jgi:hypothetical protein